MAASKEVRLIEWIRAQGSVLVGYSGGVDSAYLACVAVDTLGPDRVLAVIGRSASYPIAQWQTARAVADRFAVPVLEIDTDELDDPDYAANPTNRCYYCKRELWERLLPIARDRGFQTVVDGTNADDTHDDRPGARAAAERNVRSPLADVGLTKAEIRALSHARGLPTWDQPSAPCLASRIPHGTPVTPARLRRVEAAEAALRTLGVTGDLRVRHHGALARLELPADQLDHWCDETRAVALGVAVRDAGYQQVAIDLAGFRSGALHAAAIHATGECPTAARRTGERLTGDDATDGDHEFIELPDLRFENVFDRGVLLVRGPRGWAIDAARRRLALDAGRRAGFPHVAVAIDDAGRSVASAESSEAARGLARGAGRGTAHDAARVAAEHAARPGAT